MERSNTEIVYQTNDIARKFYKMMGYDVKDDFEFFDAKHPQEIFCWEAACHAQEVLTSTEMCDVMEEFREDQMPW